MPCPIFGWIAATGLIIGYTVELDGQPLEYVTQNRVEICIEDEGVHVIRIIAINAYGSLSHSEFIGTLAENTAGEPAESPPIVLGYLVPPSVAADLNRNNVVDYLDFGTFISVFGAENDGIQEISGGGGDGG